MMQKGTYHTHTNFSDGKNTIEEMISKAVELGLEEIGITDHLVVHKNMKQSFSWKRLGMSEDSWIYRNNFNEAFNAFSKHTEEIRKISKKYPIKVYTAAEVDFFTYSGWKEEFDEFRKNADLDYYITGNHFFELEDEQVMDQKDISVLSLPEQINAVNKHFDTMADAVKSKIFKFIAHIDYVRKVQICSDSDFINEKVNLIKAIKDAGCAVELSTKGIRKRGDFYPSDNLVKILIDFNIPIIISDDAHRTSELYFAFDKAEQYLAELSYFNRLKI